MYQENNLDIAGQLLWVMAPPIDTPKENLPPFVIVESGKFFAREKFFSRRSGKEGYLFLYTQSGKGRLTYNGSQYALLPGSIVIIDCFQAHEYKTYDESDGSWSFFWLHFESDHMKFYIDIIYRESFLVLDVGELLVTVFDNVLQILPFGNQESLLFLNDSVIKILTRMIEAAKAGIPISKKETAHRETMTKAAEYIKANHWKPFNLESIAKHFDMSKFYFIKLFKKHIGITPNSYLITERVNVAKKLLRTTNLKISEISLMVGFLDEGNFIRTFKSISGITPKSYRFDE